MNCQAPSGTVMRSQPLTQQQELARLHERTGLEAIEVDAAGEAAAVELDFMIAGLDISVHQFGDFLPDGVVDGEKDMTSIRQSKSNGSRWVERVWEIFTELKPLRSVGDIGAHISDIRRRQRSRK